MWGGSFSPARPTTRLRRTMVAHLSLIVFLACFAAKEKNGGKENNAFTTSPVTPKLGDSSFLAVACNPFGRHGVGSRSLGVTAIARWRLRWTLRLGAAFPPAAKVIVAAILMLALPGNDIICEFFCWRGTFLPHLEERQRSNISQKVPATGYPY